MRYSDPVVALSLTALWIMVLLNLVLTLRLARWHQARREQQELFERMERAKTLEAGAPAPPFSARDLAGRPVTSGGLRGTTTLLTFVSPQCGSCSANLPGLLDLGDRLRAARAADLVLISDSPLQRTRSWVAELGLDVEARSRSVWVAPLEHSGLFETYNPRGLLPYFCAVDADGTVLGQGPLGEGEWDRVLARLSEGQRS